MDFNELPSRVLINKDGGILCASNRDLVGQPFMVTKISPRHLRDLVFLQPAGLTL
jgi:hypothetical protein